MMNNDSAIKEFQESFAFKSGVKYERRRIAELLRIRRCDLRELDGPAMLTRNARLAADELSRVISLIEDID